MAKKNQLKKLLKQKVWSGKEVGQLLIASMLNDMKQQKQEEKTPLFLQSDFEKMEASLTSDRDYITYGVYRDLYSSIIDSYNRGQGLYQQFYNGFSRLYTELREVELADNAQRINDDTPLIVTEHQYNRLEAEAVQTLRENKESYYSLFFHLLEECLNAGDEATEPIRNALEATKNIPAEKISFARSYNEHMGEGYYTLPDGRRSDQLTSTEWKDALRDCFLDKHKLTIDGKPATAEETLRHYNQSRLSKGYELFFKGSQAIREFALEQTGKELSSTDGEIEEAINEIISLIGNYPYDPTADQIAEALDFSPLTKWHIYEELPEGLTAYDLLGFITDSSQYTDTDRKKHLKAFKTEYKELYTALNAYIEEKAPNIKGLKPNQLCKDIVSWGELADAGFMGYINLIKPNSQQIADSWTNEENSTRDKKKSVAIIKNPEVHQTDEKGNYVEHKSPLILFQSLYDLEENESKIASIHDYTHTLIYPALGYLYAFNALMEIIGNVYDLPELAKVARYDTSTFEYKMNAFNDLLYIVYHDVYGNEKEKEHKRAILKDVFSPLEADTLKPSQEAIEEITEELTQLGFSSEARKELKFIDAFLDRLMTSGEGA